MSGFGKTNQGWLPRLLGEFQRDRKKTAVLLGLLAVAGFLGARAVWNVSSSPAGAAGAVAAPVLPAAPGLAAVATAGVGPSRGAAKDAPAFPRPSASRRAASRDLFALQLDGYPPALEAKLAPAAAEPASQPADPEQLRVEAVQAKARGLSLQSTFLSAAPRAIINDQLVGVGDMVQGFQVVEVSNRACVLVQDGVRVRIEMSDQ